MSGSVTVVAVKGATIPTSGDFTGQALTGFNQVLANALANAPQDILTYNPTNGGIPSVPAGANGPIVLVVPNDAAGGTLAIPDNFDAVVFGQGSSGTVTGGAANTTVLSAGSINYHGNAGAILESASVAGTTATIVDNAQGAAIELGGGNYSVTAGGNQQAIKVDNGAQTLILASGDNDTVQLGNPAAAADQPPTAPGPGNQGTPGPGNNIDLTGSSALVTVGSFGNIIGDNGAGSSTILGVSGSSTIFASSNDVYVGSGAVAEFISSAGAQTVFGGAGNDTVFNTAGGSTTYIEGSGGANIFVADDASNSTVFGAGAGAVFGGAGHTDLILGNSGDLFVGGNGGSDDVYGGGVTPTVFGGSNETLQVAGSTTSFIVASGNNSVLDASLTDGGNNFFASSSTGNSTLVGASGPGPDTFTLNSVTGGSAHALTIENWHAGDGLFLNGYSAGDIQTMDMAILGGKSSFTLSDGTTVTFQGAQPTHVAGGAAF